MISKRYDLINNIGGWLVFVIALLTYWLTLEPTASYWDCGEFIIQADKLEVGHPPGNPIFMLTARFFANFAPDAQHVALMVNAMSGLLSALTILLLFWTITHLVRKLVVKDDQKKEISLQQYLAIMGSGLVGSLAYCWSDTFWFSAVEGEVYAFSSFCTALVFWLILKWENRADQPHSDRYLILIAYIIGVSVAVHLLNLLCIPAIVLVFVYKKFSDMNVAKSLGALLVSFIIIALVLYGLVPGFMKVAQQFELLFVNGFGSSYNGGALAYAIVMLLLFCWSLYELQAQTSGLRVRLSFFLAITASGMLFFGSGPWIGIVLTFILGATLWVWFRRGLPVRVLSVIMWSTAVIFVGYSSYTLILIRSTADTPMNQNSPDNVFELASYLNREQYGSYPLIYGETMNSLPQRILLGYDMRNMGGVNAMMPVYDTQTEQGKALYAKGVEGAVPQGGGLSREDSLENAKKIASGAKAYYVKKGYDRQTVYNPELNMFFPRLYSNMHGAAYEEWINPNDYEVVTLSAIDSESGHKVPEYDLQGDYKELQASDGSTYYAPVSVKKAKKPSMGQNLSYFFNYQLNHMYMRYFMWNFAGRQNDIMNMHGEYDVGNWISGIPAIDNARLGDQSLLPEDLGDNNPGHNVYYMLPLILGILGLLWQAFAGKRGIEQFWVVFFLFFMTGIAIVIYLNQPPNQPRERDYAFAGSFYAFAIWIGMGVAALWRILLYFVATRKLVAEKNKANPDQALEEPLQVESIVDEPASIGRKSLICAAIACGFGIIVPLQMVSQTWDDHDRSGRYAARDFAVNYLESLEPNAIIFCNGDNDTFPLWYAQEVEGVRPDVRIINISYLSSEWYANQMKMQAYESAPVPMTATSADYAFDRLSYAYIDSSAEAMGEPLLEVWKKAYKEKDPLLTSPVYIPVDKETVIKRGLVAPRDSAQVLDRMYFDLEEISASHGVPVLTLNEILMLDIVATNAARGWERPIYIATSVGNEFHAGLTPYTKQVGMALQVLPTYQQDIMTRADKAYEVIRNKYRWGGGEKEGKKPYLDETAGRMYYAVRLSAIETAAQLIADGDDLATDGNEKGAQDCYKKSLELIDLVEKNMPASVQPLQTSPALSMGVTLWDLSQPERLNNPALADRGRKVLETILVRQAPYLRYNTMLNTNFGTNAARHYTTLAVPYQYLSLYNEYKRIGGDAKPIEAALKKVGTSLATLEQQEAMMQQRQEAAYSSEGDTQGAGEETLQYILSANGTVRRVEKLSPEEYAALSSDEKEVDSIYYGLLEYLMDDPTGQSLINMYPEILQVDTARSHRLWNMYNASNPE